MQEPDEKRLSLPIIESALKAAPKLSLDQVIDKMKLKEHDLRTQVATQSNNLEGKDLEFFKKLCNMSHKVKTFNEYFGERQPAYVENFRQRKFEEQKEKVMMNLMLNLSKKMGIQPRRHKTMVVSKSPTTAGQGANPNELPILKLVTRDKVNASSSAVQGQGVSQSMNV